MAKLREWWAVILAVTVAVSLATTVSLWWAVGRNSQRPADQRVHIVEDCSAKWWMTNC